MGETLNYTIICTYDIFILQIIRQRMTVYQWYIIIYSLLLGGCYDYDNTIHVNVL